MDTIRQPKIQTENFWDTITGKVESVLRRNIKPVMVIDLDGTIVNYTLRTRMIFLKAIELNGLPSSLIEVIDNIKPEQYEFSPRKTLANVGISDDASVTAILDYWNKYYFSNDYLYLDKQMPGAYDFVQNIRALKIEVVFLTGRDYQNMGEGTRAWLEKNRFLTNGDSRRCLLMKDDLNVINYEAKARNRDKIAAVGQPILIIDNEPVELQTMLRYFSEAFPVLVDSPNSGRPAQLPEVTLRVKDFVELNSHFANTR